MWSLVDAVAGVVGIVEKVCGAFSLYRDKKKKEKRFFKTNWISADKLKISDLTLRPEYEYIPRNEDGFIINLIREQTNILLTGPPLAGKTRTLFENIKKFGKSLDVIVPRPEDIDYGDYPFPDPVNLNYIQVVVLDDLDRFVEKSNFEMLLEIVRDKNLIILATCQTEEKYNLVSGKLEIGSIFGENIINIGQISDEKAQQIAQEAHIDLNNTEFNHTIGSIFMPLLEMRGRYNSFDYTEKALLKSIKKLHIAGLYKGNHIFPYEWVEKVFKKDNPTVELIWEHVLENLKEKQFVVIPEENQLYVEEVYLEKIVEFNDRQSDYTIINNLLTVFTGDPDALFSIGYRASSLALILKEKRDFSKISIKAYEEALKIRTFTDFPIQYAMTQYNLGIAYNNLADVESKKDNLEKAIKAYEEALKIRTFTDFPIQYAMTQNNLGIAYNNLADVESKKDNLEKAIKAYEEALKIRTFTDFPMDYAMTQYNLGSAYNDLADVESKKDNLEKAIKAYEEALKIRTFTDFPMDYAMTQNNLGIAYNNLADVESKKDNLEKAIKAYEEALKMYTIDAFPMDYAMTQYNLGIAYNDLADVESKKDNLEKAIKAYEEALKIYTIDAFPMDYAMTQYNLGIAYNNLADVESKKDNLEKAIKAYEEALKIYTIDAFPMDYAMTQNNLGIAYRNLADVESKKDNLEKAIKAYEEALKIYTIDAFPIQYAMIQYNLGSAYRNLADVESKKDNLEKAIKAYEEAVKGFENQNIMQDQVTILKQNIDILKQEL